MAGLSDKEIAATLHVSVHSIRTYWTRIREKLGVATRAEVLAAAGCYRFDEASSSKLQSLLAEADRLRLELEDILGKIPILVWSFAVPGAVHHVNDRFLEYTGLTAAECMANPWPKLIPPEALDGVQADFEMASAFATPYEHEIPLRRADGAYRWHLVRTIPIFDAEGVTRVRVGTATDIHDVHERERVIADREKRLSLLADLSSVGVAYADVTKNVYYSNQAFQRITGAPATVVAWTTPVHPDDRKSVRRKWQEAVDLGIELDSEHRYLHRNGTIVWARVRVLPLEDEGWVMTVENLTDVHAKQETRASMLKLRSLMDAVLQAQHHID